MSSSTETQVNQILNNISQIQLSEQQLYNELENSMNTSTVSMSQPTYNDADVKWCVNAKKIFGVVENSSWGRMKIPALQNKWNELNCNVLSNPPPPPQPSSNSNASTPELTTTSQHLISRINQLSSIRMSLYENLNYIYNTVQQSNDQNNVSLENLKKAVEYSENALNQTKDRFNQLHASRDNKMRMVEINAYYGKWYKAQAQIIKICVVILVIITILFLIRRRGILNNNILNIAIAIVITAGVYLLFIKYIDVSSRNNMNFDVYDWGGMADIPQNTSGINDISLTTGLTDDVKKSFMSSFEGIGCFGDQCCSSGMKYDKTVRKCLDSSSISTFTSNNLATNVHNSNHTKNSSTEIPIASNGY